MHVSAYSKFKSSKENHNQNFFQNNWFVKNGPSLKLCEYFMADKLSFFCICAKRFLYKS